MSVNLATQTADVDDAVDCSWQQILSTVVGSPHYSGAQLEEFAKAFVDYSPIFRIRCSTIAGQSNHETGYLTYGGQVTADQYNFFGLGATNDGRPGGTFKGMNHGVLAGYCHAALYMYGDIENWPVAARPLGYNMAENGYMRIDAVTAADKTIHRDLLEPEDGAGPLLRYLNVVDKVGDYLNGRHAWSPEYKRGTLDNGYAQNMANKANQIRESDQGVVEPVPPADGNYRQGQIPRTYWVPSNFFEARPRGIEITHKFHHHTDGYNSLLWLTKNGNVSSTFLVAHNPSEGMSDAIFNILVNTFGFDPDQIDRSITTLQLVRIEDRPWTTGRCNDFSISTEFERKSPEQSHVHSSAYTEMARVDAAAIEYVGTNNLGHIPANRQHIQMHRECPGESTSCPGNLDVDYIVDLVRALQEGPGDSREINGFTLRGEFLDRYELLESIELAAPQVGFPLSEEYVEMVEGEGERTFQNFERAKFKLHLENDGVWRVVSQLFEEAIGG